MTSSHPDCCQRLPSGLDDLMSEKEWAAIAPWFVGQPDLCQDLHTIVGRMSLPCRRSFLTRLSERLNAHPGRQATRHMLDAVVSLHVESGHASGQQRVDVLRAVSRPQPTLP